jgi:hypothetical protein
VQKNTDREDAGRYAGRKFERRPGTLENSIGEIVMKPRTPRRHVVCQYCGLASAASIDHASAVECVAALEREVHRLRECLRHGRFSIMGPAKSVSDPANGVAVSPRLLQVR